MIEPDVYGRDDCHYCGGYAAYECCRMPLCERDYTRHCVEEHHAERTEE